MWPGSSKPVSALDRWFYDKVRSRLKGKDIVAKRRPLHPPSLLGLFEGESALARITIHSEGVHRIDVCDEEDSGVEQRSDFRAQLSEISIQNNRRRRGDGDWFSPYACSQVRRNVYRLSCEYEGAKLARSAREVVALKVKSEEIHRTPLRAWEEITVQVEHSDRGIDST